MKKLPYTSCFVIVQVDSFIRKMFFDKVIDYKDYSNPDFNEHKKVMAQMAVVDNKYADELFMQLVQAYLNSTKVIKEFKLIANETCESTSELCVTLIVDVHVNEDDSGTIEICTLANDEKRDGFNYIAQYVSDEGMGVFVRSLTVMQQDLLFDFA